MPATKVKTKASKTAKAAKGGRLSLPAPAIVVESPEPSQAIATIGATVGSAASPLPHARHAPDLPQGWLARYYGSLSEGDTQLSLIGEIALVDALIADLAQQLQCASGDEQLGSVGDWKEAVYAYRLLRRGKMERDKLSQNAAMLRLDAVFETAGNSRHVREELRENLTLRKRLVESEVSVQTRLGKLIPTAEAEQIIEALLHAVKSEVTDKDLLKRIGQRFKAISPPVAAAVVGQAPTA